MSDEEMEKAREAVEKRSEQTDVLGEEVRKVAARLRHQRTENHFGPLIWAALRGESDV
ncbi:hypothetical protein NGM33_28680 [Nocardiopsis dassonvillei]|uniref:DUF7620 family protein n=1 Tax=Nocardiopsis dassonvillei TaxID=2014 RepID=UPI00157DE22E|nr:hypothetical protein [Nocardiopsis dassonvillei]MCP3017313.1 hypothetical protein [Nocardiopsis dassonvillei]